MRIAILSSVLFISGVSALIFETLWLRLSGLAFGNSVWAAALILSSFMGGLALGTAIAASSKLQRVRPLRLYAGLEFAVALLGCTIVFALPVIGEYLRPVFHALWSHQTILLGLRVVLSFVILLVPTTAMGLSLPVVLEDQALQRHDFGHAVGLLYGWNTLGAVVGALLSEAYLVKTFGLWGTSLAAGLLNCLAAAIALFLVNINGVDQVMPAQPGWFRLELNYRLPWRLLLTSFGAGWILLALEVVWFRFLRLYVASSSAAFSLMLAIVLAGIGLGGIVSGALPRRTANLWLPVLLIVTAISTLLCYTLFPVPTLREGEANFYFEDWRTIGLLSLALMFPVAFFSGILFPSVTARVQENVQNRMNSVGVTTLFNTAGAAIGPLLTGFILLPKLGFQSNLILCAVGYALLCLLMNETWSVKRPMALALLGFCALFVLVLVTFPFHRDETHFANARRLFETEGQHLVKKIEGTADTWQLLRRDLFGEPYYYRLVTNGFSMSATNPRNQRYMRLFAYLPIALRPQARDALLIAYGCGVTADALTHDADLKQITVVDISKEVFALAGDYRDAGYSNPLRDPRATAIVQDGRFFLQASPRRYDIITGEPPPPKVAGAVNLYTEQFFSLMREQLNEGGIATFWLPIYQLNVGEAKSILRGFHDAFPNTLVWSSSDEEWIMMGIKGAPEKVNQEQFRNLWRNAKTREDLARIGIEAPEQLAGLFLMDSDEIDRITSGLKPLTDSYPKRLSDDTTEDKSIHEFAWSYINATSAAQRFGSSQLIRQIWPDLVKESVGPFFAIREIRYRAGLSETNWLAELDIHLRASRLREPVLDVLGTNSFRVAMAEKTANRLQTSPPAELLPDLIAAALARRDYDRAIQLLEAKRAKVAADRNDLFLLTYLYCLNGNTSAAEFIADKIPDREDSLAKWLWGKLKAEYGFRPPS